MVTSIRWTTRAVAQRHPHTVTETRQTRSSFSVVDLSCNLCVCAITTSTSVTITWSNQRKVKHRLQIVVVVVVVVLHWQRRLLAHNWLCQQAFQMHSVALQSVELSQQLQPHLPQSVLVLIAQRQRRCHTQSNVAGRRRGRARSVVHTCRGRVSKVIVCQHVLDWRCTGGLHQTATLWCAFHWTIVIIGAVAICGAFCCMPNSTTAWHL
jgi:hypothetical protein